MQVYSPRCVYSTVYRSWISFRPYYSAGRRKIYLQQLLDHRVWVTVCHDDIQNTVEYDIPIFVYLSTRWVEKVRASISEGMMSSLDMYTDRPFVVRSSLELGMVVSYPIWTGDSIVC